MPYALPRDARTCCALRAAPCVAGAAATLSTRWRGSATRFRRRACPPTSVPSTAAQSALSRASPEPASPPNSTSRRTTSKRSSIDAQDWQTAVRTGRRRDAVDADASVERRAAGRRGGRERALRGHHARRRAHQYRGAAGIEDDEARRSPTSSTRDRRGSTRSWMLDGAGSSESPNATEERGPDRRARERCADAPESAYRRSDDSPSTGASRRRTRRARGVGTRMRPRLSPDAGRRWRRRPAHAAAALATAERVGLADSRRWSLGCLAARCSGCLRRSTHYFARTWSVIQQLGHVLREVYDRLGWSVVAELGPCRVRAAAVGQWRRRRDATTA